MNDAIGETDRSADHVLDASGKVSGASAQLAAEVLAFVKLLNVPLDRRERDDPPYKGPNRRADGLRAAQAKARAPRDAALAERGSISGTLSAGGPVFANGARPLR